MSHILWTDKHVPKKIKEFKSNKKVIKEIENWIKNHKINKKKYYENKKNKKKDKKKSTLLITGKHGVGKTVIVKTILEEYGYDIYDINMEFAKNNKNYKKNIKEMMKKPDILRKIKEKKREKKVIVIDELESITSNKKKKIILTLLKLNDTEWFCPIIFISNEQHSKIISDIKKTAEHIKIYEPKENELREIIEEICEKEKINLDQEIYDEIIKHSQNDIRRLIYTLQDIKYMYGENEITLEILENYLELSKEKDIDIDLFKETNKIFTNFNSINENLKYYETDKTLLPLMIQENYIKIISQNTDKNKIKKIKEMKRIIENLSYGDIVENYIYGDQNWDMQEIHGYYTCVTTSYYISEYLKNKKKIYNRLAFPADLNRTSIKKINKKNINNTNKYFDNMYIFDYIYINNIFNKILKNDDLDECVKILNEYNINLEYIDSLLKIDKIKNDKMILSSKQKKKLNSILYNTK